MIIVTGGAGFIGSALVWGLNRRSISDILVVDHLGCSEKWKNLRNLSFQDYLEKDQFIKLIQKNKLTISVDAILHMGACSSTTETDASYLSANNYQYTKDLATYAVNSNIRFIYASSAATYGNGSNGYDDEMEPTNLKPLNMYGYSKQLFDLWAIKRGVLSRMVGLKFSNVFGPNEYHKGNMRSMVKKAFEQIQSDGKVRLFKSYKPDYLDGEQMRDFIYVKDAAAMTLFFLERQEVNGTFNVGSGVARTWNDLTKAVFTALNKEPQIEYIEMPEAIRDQYQYFTELKIDKVRSVGCNKPLLSLEEGVEDYVHNYLISGNYLNPYLM